MSMNKNIVANTMKQVTAINELLNLENWIAVGFNEGRGYYIEFPDNDFTHMLMRKRFYVNKGNETHVNFLLNRYEKGFSEEMINNYLNFMSDDEIKKLFDKIFE